MATQGWEVGVLGATGMVGQHLVRRLETHPWFRLAWLAASERSEGRRYGDLPWLLGGNTPDGARDRLVEKPIPGRAPRLLFSALDDGGNSLDPETCERLFNCQGEVRDLATLPAAAAEAEQAS